MQIVYRAYDGEHFYTEAECLEHEEKHPLFTMYDEDGRTNSTDSAEVIHLPDNEGVSAFVDICEEEGIDHTGVEHYSLPGWYVWDADQCGYLSLSEPAISALTQAFKE